MPDALHSLLKVPWLGMENTGYKSLRVSIVQWEPARLDLDHETMSRSKHVVRSRKGKAICKRFIGCNCFWRFQTFTVASTKDISSNHELITAHLRVASDFIRVDIDELYNPVAVCTARGSIQVDQWTSTDLQWFCQYVGFEYQDVWPSRCLSLIIDQPLRPGISFTVPHRQNRPRPIRNRLHWIRNEFVVSWTAAVWCSETQC